MDLVHQRFQQIEDIFQSMNIYNTVLIYDDLNEFHLLKSLMLSNEYTFKSISNNARIYDIYFSNLEDEICNIDLSTISLVLCIGDKGMHGIKKILNNNISNLILIISI
jgi:hypothetical protein